MGKIYNIQLNSQSGTVNTTTSNITYNISWQDLLPNDKQFKLTFAFLSALNFGRTYAFPYITTNILGNTFKPATNGFQNAYYLGHLIPIMSATDTYCNYVSSTRDNPPIYLDRSPMNNNLQIRVLNSFTNTDFEDAYQSVAGTGTLTQSGFIITVVTATTGLITVGTIITVATVARLVTQFITGTGGVGTYLCDTSATVATATAYTFPADNVANPISPYILNLSFEEVDNDD